MNPEDEGRAPEPVTRRCFRLLFMPQEAFRDIRTEPLAAAVTWYGLLLLLSLFLTVLVALVHYDAVMATAPRWPPTLSGSLVAALLPMVLLFVAGTAIFACIFHLLVYLSGGREGPARTLAALLYAATPVLLGFWALEAGWLYGIILVNVLIPLLFGWAVVIAAAGLRELHGLSVMRSALPFFLFVILVLLVVAVVLYFAYSDQCGGCASKVTAVTAACTGEQINVTYQGGQDAAMLVNITVYDTDRTRARVMGGPDGILPVGTVLVLDGPFHSPANVIAFAHFTDGSEQVILDTRMECGSGPKLTRTPAGA